MDGFFATFAAILAPLIIGGTALGIIGKYVYDYAVRYWKAVDKTTVAFDLKGFLLSIPVSLILSLILYSTVLERVGNTNDGVLVLSIAAQNGFFWQAVVGEVGKKYAPDKV